MGGVRMISRHQPSRPSWRCTGCDSDWPCPRRRKELLDENTDSTVPLALFMAGYFQDALADHPTVLVGNLYLRFFGWVRRRSC
jgi:hypothetical protein